MRQGTPSARYAPHGRVSRSKSLNRAIRAKRGEAAPSTLRSAVTASRDASVVTVLGESVMNDMTDTTEGSRVCRVSDDGCGGRVPDARWRVHPQWVNLAGASASKLSCGQAHTVGRRERTGRGAASFAQLFVDCTGTSRSHLGRPQQMIDHYFDVMTGGGDFAVYYTADVTWTMTDTGDEVRGPSSVRDYVVGLHNNMLDAHTPTIVVSEGHAYIKGDCKRQPEAPPDALLRHVRHRRWPNHSDALLRSDCGHGSLAH